MGNTTSLGNIQSAPVVCEQKIQNAPVVCEQEIQCDSVVCEPVIQCAPLVHIHIVLPNYTYSWEGDLAQAPHTVHKMTDLEWATHMENTLLRQRKSCPWVIEHEKSRETHIQNYKNSRSGTTYSGDLNREFYVQPVPFCCSEDCPGRLHTYRRLGRPCMLTCYYKHKKETEEHTKKCKLCSSVH